MKRTVVALLLPLAACSVQPDKGSVNKMVVGEETAPVRNAAPVAPPLPAPPAVRETVSEAPFTPTSAQGAANVVQTYYAFLEAKKFAAAHKLWGPASDLADRTFAEQFAGYREYHAEVYAPGEIEGAAGSLYVEVPVRTYGVASKGARFSERSVVTLRRVNDVPGSTAEQRRWHIERIARAPAPH